MNLSLTIELVPSTAWYDNVRDIVSKDQWDIIRKQVYDAAWHVCEICGGFGPKHPVEAHEIWYYNDDTGIQTLIKIVSLCPSCHQVKHIGLAQIKGKFEEALKHFIKVNKVSRNEALKYLKLQFNVWKNRSEKQWKLDVSKLKDYGIDVDKLVLK